MLTLEDRVKISYKKLKASVFYDKTRLPLRDQITAYEDSDIEKKLAGITEKLSSKDETWDQYINEILDSISAFVYPKSLNKVQPETVIFNSDSTPIQLKDPQFFIDLAVEGHILSVLWILSIGRTIDKNCGDGTDGMYEHSYGNRLKKDLLNENSNDITYSPYLFEPYFAQYESWRDYGLDRARERLKDKQDALILTLDFKSFYYSVDLRIEDFEGFLKNLDSQEKWLKRVNRFVYDVLSKYSDKLRAYCDGTETSIDERTVLPIGFLPSNILANWVLTPFDDAIIKQWNPVYYGRYVDDVIIVDKVEKNSPLYKEAREKDGEKTLSASRVVEMFLAGNNAIVKNDTNDGGESVYRVCPNVLLSKKNNVQFQNGKVKVFYFQSGSTQALLNCFRTKIAQNASEFRLMPNMDRVLLDKDYSEIFQLKNSDSINKFRSVEGITVDKFPFSKFLGKYRKVSGLINDKKEENVFEKDLALILDERMLIENYTMWERILEILVVNDRIKLLEKISLRILSAIIRYEVAEIKVHKGSISVKDGLLRVFHAALCRSSALIWGNDIRHALKCIGEYVSDNQAELGCTQGLIKDFELSNLQHARLNYCRTRMVNKYVLPLPIDCVLNAICADDSIELRPCDLTDTLKHQDTSWEKSGYNYYPYIVTPQEISFALMCELLCKIPSSYDPTFDPEQQAEKLNTLFLDLNYPNVESEGRDVYNLREVTTKKIKELSKPCFLTRVAKTDNSDKRDLLCVAIGNAELRTENFDAALDLRPNRSYHRYRDLSSILDAAIEQNVDLLVLPENYLPLEWLPAVSRLCANNQMALVTGIEHIVVPSKNSDDPLVYNLTATILPYEHQNQKFAHISYHNKVRYSPEEKQRIIGRHRRYHEGNIYQLFCWHDVWFPVYCCYELSSIQDRALFRSYADMVVAVEWNQDIPYFSSIIEALCRDLHCYCIQANSSGPGDSRIIQPSRSEQRDIIKTKGGKNPCILAADISIRKLRDFQVLDYTLQKDSKVFKPTPPDLDLKIVEAKRNGNCISIILKQDNS